MPTLGDKYAAFSGENPALSGKLRADATEYKKTMSKRERKKISPLKQTIIVWLLKLSALMPLWMSHALGTAVGWLMAFFSTRAYTTTMTNLTLCFPNMAESERKTLARQSLIETGKVILETGAVWLRSYEWVRSKVINVRNEHVMHNALAQGRGIIILAPHLGNWEVLGLYLNDFGKVTCLYKPPESEALGEIMVASRERAGSEIVPTNRKGVIALMKAVKAGGMTGILPDQNPEASGGEFAPFYGVPAFTMTLVQSLRIRADAVVIGAYAKRIPGGFEVVFEEADEAIYSSNDSEALAGLNRTVEKCVNGAMSQYQWEYKRFNVRNNGSERPYTK